MPLACAKIVPCADEDEEKVQIVLQKNKKHCKTFSSMTIDDDLNIYCFDEEGKASPKKKLKSN